MNEPIEVKAIFTSIAIKKNTTLQFELSSSFESELPNLTKVANTVVFLTIASEQQPLPIDDDEDVCAEKPEEQEQLPVDDVIEDEQEESELDEPEDEDGSELDSERDDYYPDEPFVVEDGEL